MIKSLKHRVSATRCDKQFKEKYMLCFWKQLHEYTENFLPSEFEHGEIPSSTSANTSKITHCSYCYVVTVFTIVAQQQQL